VILVDTSVWIDHLKSSEPRLVEHLEGGQVVSHPMVVGELALGSIRNRAAFLHLLSSLPETRLATHDEVLGLIEDRTLHGSGLSLVDAHLLAAALLTPDTVLWTRDKGLHRAAAGLGCAWSVSAPKRRR